MLFEIYPVLQTSHVHYMRLAMSSLEISKARTNKKRCDISNNVIWLIKGSLISFIENIKIRFLMNYISKIFRRTSCDYKNWEDICNRMSVKTPNLKSILTCSHCIIA